MSLMSVHPAPPTAALLVSARGGLLLDALVAVDRWVVSVGLLVLLGGAGFLAVARLPWAASRMTRRLQRRAFWLLRNAWWAALAGSVAGLLLRGPFAARLPLSRALDPRLLGHTLGTRFGGLWTARVLLLLALPFLEAWSQREAPRQRGRTWFGVAGLAAVLVVTTPLGGHAAEPPDVALGVAIGVLHFSAVAVWFGGLILLGACVLPRPDVGLLEVVPRFSAVAFGSMAVIVATGAAQSLRQVEHLDALVGTAYGRLLLGKLAAFLLLVAVAGRSRVLVRRRLAAAAAVGAALGGGAGPPGPGDPGAAPARLLRRLVLAEAVIALLVLALTAVLGITAPPRRARAAPAPVGAAQPPSSARTAAAWPSALTSCQARSTRPCSSTRKVDRSTPTDVRP